MYLRNSIQSPTIPFSCSFTLKSLHHLIESTSQRVYWASGTLVLYTYRSPVPKSPSSLTSINYSDSHHLLATGSSSGIITVYDTRSIGIPLTSFSRLETVIEDLAFIYSNQGVGLATASVRHCRWTPISSKCGPRKTCR